MFHRIPRFIVFCLLPLQLIAQDFNGVWTGTISTAGNDLPYELIIGDSAGVIRGYSMTVFTINGVENMGIKLLNVKTKRNTISLEDDRIVWDNYSSKSRKLTVYASLNLHTGNGQDKLEGSFYTRSADRSGFKGTIVVYRATAPPTSRLYQELAHLELGGSLLNQRSASAATAASAPPVMTDPAAVTVPSKSPDPKPVSEFSLQHIPVSTKPINTKPMTVRDVSLKTPPKLAAADIEKRNIEVIRTINFVSDSLTLTLYDNGEVDGDTVSVLVNGQLVFARQGLTTQPAIAHYQLKPSDGDSLKVIMYAENLGRIAPNTGLLLIQDGEERYDVRFEGDLQKNAAVLLRRRR